MKVRAVSVTKPLGDLKDLSAEDLIVHNARVSNPKNQTNTSTGAKLLRYCAQNSHHSIFEQVSFCVEIQTSRAIAAQIIRHKSFNFQEFSQRYSTVTVNEKVEPRRQDIKNRQNSIDDLSDYDRMWFDIAQDKVWNDSYKLYEEALSRGIAKESARMLLPLSTSTTLYMNGTLRSWIHYVAVRTHESTQKEHRDIAEAIKTLLIEHFPTTAEAFGWTSNNQQSGD